MIHLGIPGVRKLSQDIWAGGQPDAEQLRGAARAGLKTVISHCPAGECGRDERTVAESQGRRYASLPLGGACDLTENAAHRQDAVLETRPKPAPAHGRAAGLTGPDTAVRAILSPTGDQT